jgi:hypothetical protein
VDGDMGEKFGGDFYFAMRGNTRPSSWEKR